MCTSLVLENIGLENCVPPLPRYTENVGPESPLEGAGFLACLIRESMVVQYITEIITPPSSCCPSPDQPAGTNIIPAPVIFLFVVAFRVIRPLPLADQLA